MTFSLDNSLLQSIGLTDLSPAAQRQILSELYETLESRVGLQLARLMSDRELDDFETFIRAGDEQGALDWLKANLANYEDVVSQSLGDLLAALQVVADFISDDLAPA